MPDLPLLRVCLGEAVGKDWLGLLRAWDGDTKITRLLEYDRSLWTDTDEDRWLGWLGSAERECARLDELLDFQQRIRETEFRHAVLLGMGGSSLGPEVQARVVGSRAGYPRLIVLDSTDPVQLASVLDRIDPDATLVIAASKSGGTLETALLLDAFWSHFSEPGALEGDPAKHFVAITDPGSALDERAAAASFLAVFHGETDIGGRFSVLSPFGLVPAAVIGLDLERWLAGVSAMADACRIETAADNPGVALGLLLAAAAGRGQNKVMLVGSESVPGLGAWLEQLIAESTGKSGRMVLPFDGEPLRAAESYLDSRLFVAIGPQPVGEVDLTRFEGRGHSVASILMESPYDLGGEFYRWMVATAVLGAELGVNPFDQPDVEAAKVVARELTAALEAGEPLDRGDVLEVTESYVLSQPAATGPHAGAESDSAVETLAAQFSSLETGAYVAILAYLASNADNRESLEALRTTIAEATGAATSYGFGPRYLHSTGQAHKGGPPGGHFLVITDQPAVDLPVPDRKLTFGQVRDAQALGDARVLAERGRAVLQVQLLGDSKKALASLISDVALALS